MTPEDKNDDPEFDRVWVPLDTGTKLALMKNASAELSMQLGMKLVASVAASGIAFWLAMQARDMLAGCVWLCVAAVGWVFCARYFNMTRHYAELAWIALKLEPMWKELKNAEIESSRKRK